MCVDLKQHVFKEIGKFHYEQQRGDTKHLFLTGVLNMALSKLKTVAAVTLVAVAASAFYVFLIRPEQRITSVLKRWANDPASLVLEDMQQSKRDPEVWCGRLNARNRMGGMVGFRGFVVSAPGVNSFITNEETVEVLMNMTLDDQQGYDARRSLYCK
jgi:hypothetical protein